VTKRQLDLIHRVSLWQANGKRCFYCQEVVQFRELQIDHIIPRDTPPDQTSDLISRLGLGQGFTLDSLENLVPTHGNCNSRKSDTLYSESSLRFFLEAWRQKQAALYKEVERMNRQSSNESLLLSIATSIDNGEVSLTEVVAFLQEAITKGPTPAPEPTVVTFSMNLNENGISPSPETYDRLESSLKANLQRLIPGPFVTTEASFRTGETFSVRVGFWLFDMNRLQEFAAPGWEVTEIARYSDIYEGEAESVLINITKNDRKEMAPAINVKANLPPH